jgi:hypothetical protein
VRCDQAADLFAEEPATVLTVWQPRVMVMTRSGAGRRGRREAGAATRA